MTTVSETGRPTGREAVRAAVLKAAAGLFSARGIAAVSIRDVAAEAGVNHGLLHRHFGAKEDLLRAVMDALARRLAERAAPDAPLEALSIAQLFAVADSPYFRLLAHALLEGHDPIALQRQFPVVAGLVDAARREQAAGTLDPCVDPRVLVALGVGVALGWVLFEPFLLTATGQRDCDRDRVRAEALALCTRLVDGALRPAAPPDDPTGATTP